jgi:hypothetical protein
MSSTSSLSICGLMIQRVILVCLHAMGAVGVDTTQTISSAKETDGYDYVLVEDREKKRDLPGWLKGLDRICNIPWLKQCLVSHSKYGLKGR